MPVLGRRPRPRRSQPAIDRDSHAQNDWPATEDQLVQRARNGDRAAFEALVQRYEGRIYALTFRMVGNAEDALDLTQECFIRAYKSLPRTAGKLHVSSWLHRIAANACLDVLRRRKLIRWLPWDDARHERLLGSHPADDPERVMLARESRSLVQTVLSKMNDRYRVALVLREYEGMSTVEIGEILGVSSSAVKSALYRAREEFRILYSAETDG
ncbi:MAG TPA: sigma-70 family RNA polymerase sigma factor [Thermomicrobiales bacterium]|nr:sigma-70 family RNA polymerase sigma factor [Thermomicrobiales bacterium]